MINEYLFKDKKIIIYGAGSVGQLLTKKLKEQGIDISAYIDIRYDNINETFGKPTYSLKDFFEKYKDHCEDVCVVITIRNVFEHSKIALYFVREGYHNLIFKPISSLQNRNDSITESIDTAYEKLTSSFLVPYEKIRIYEGENLYEFRNCTFSRKTDDMIETKLPTELLFSNTLINSIWSEQSFMANYPAVKLFEAFMVSDESSRCEISNYIERFAIQGAKKAGLNTEGNWSEILIDSRIAVFEEMEKKLDLDSLFFERNCTTVETREQGGFRLIKSGKNRVSFLVAKRFQYIPVKISVDEYKKYLNLDIAKELYNYLILENITETFAPISHPYFYEYPCIASRYISACVQRIARILSEDIYLKHREFPFALYSLFIGVDDEGCQERFFERMGFCVTADHPEHKKEMICLIEKLMGVRRTIKPYSLMTNYFASVLSKDLALEKSIEVLNRTEKYCFWIGDLLPEVIKETGFIEKSIIFETVWNKRTVRCFLAIREGA